MPYLAAEQVQLGPEDVAVTLAYGALGCHLGVAFQVEDGTSMVLDLAFHRKLRVLPYPGPPGLWSAAIVAFPPTLASQVVSLLRNFIENFQTKGRPHPDYGLNMKLTVGTIQADGEYVVPEGSDGHTCATLVAEAFRAARVPLVDLLTWQENDESRAWGEAIVCMLKAYAKQKVGVGTQAIAQAKVVAKNNYGLRLLPEEVAAAAELPLDQRPAQQSALRQPAQVAVEQMRAVCTAPANRGPYQHCADQFHKKLTEIAVKKVSEVSAQAELAVPAAGDSGKGAI
jgi:hypothetical protein